jgi:stress response protein YsnF
VTDTAHVEDTVRREEFDIDENTGDTTRQNR